MSKIKIIFVCFLIPFFILIVSTLWKIKNKEEFQQKAVLSQEIRKALEVMMFDIYQGRKGSFEGVPADGLWHNRIAFNRPRQGVLEYMTKEGHLLRVSNGRAALIADNIVDMRIRRQKETPEILEIQIEAKKNVSLVSNLRIRILQ